jgi:proteic killer suppression protein
VVVEIRFTSEKMQKRCSNEKEMVKAWGPARAVRLKRRLMELMAAETLADISHLPPARCHELTGDLAGLLTVDLEHPYRLAFRPGYDPLPQKTSGGLDWTQVTKILIVKILDTH